MKATPSGVTADRTEPKAGGRCKGVCKWYRSSQHLAGMEEDLGVQAAFVFQPVELRRSCHPINVHSGAEKRVPRTKGPVGHPFVVQVLRNLSPGVRRI